MTTGITARLPVPAGTPLLGEVLTWTCAGATVRHPDLVAALRDAGLDESVARELAPRHAFTRACRKLSDRRINGKLLRFPVPAGTAEGDRSVKEAVAAGLAQLIAEHRQAVAAFGADTRDDTLRRAAERIRTTRLKVEGYAELLAEERCRLERAVAEAQEDLRAKVAELASVPALA